MVKDAAKKNDKENFSLYFLVKKNAKENLWTNDKNMTNGSFSIGRPKQPSERKRFHLIKK